MKTKWRLLDTGFNNPYTNMAIDEALIHGFKDSSLPILRFYNWSLSAISIGYSQRAGNVLNIKQCKKEKLPIIRRPTGGGVVFHGTDITYSVILPENFNLNIQNMFIWIQKNIQKGLQSLGIDVNLYDIKKGNYSKYCFTAPNISDLMLGNNKLSGLAGRRIKNKVLCQGYIYFEDASYMTRFTKTLKTLDNAINIRQILNKEIPRQIITKAIIKNWDGTFHKDALSDKEQQLTETLENTKYSQDTWNYKR